MDLTLLLHLCFLVEKYNTFNCDLTEITEKEQIRQMSDKKHQLMRLNNS